MVTRRNLVMFMAFMRHATALSHFRCRKTIGWCNGALHGPRNFPRSSSGETKGRPPLYCMAINAPNEVGRDSDLFAAFAAADEIIDVRAPCEYAQDHVPGSVNLPVLDNDERSEIGTKYAANHFDAKRRGAALVARNIAGHLETHFTDKPGGYRPLVYCWRGGGRSNSMALVLAQVGWRVDLLEGGYKAYRAAVRSSLQTLPGTFRFKMLAGLTGTGKTELLKELELRGACQVLDLEGLANHRGSLLGAVPETKGVTSSMDTQPSQKMFESYLVKALSALDPSKPVWLEAESSKIGQLQAMLQ